MEDINVYTNKDGRKRAYIKHSKRVVSYPRLIMEEKVGRSLEGKEQIHHIDGNPLNNDFSNLEIRFIGDHQREHSTKYTDTVAICRWCGKEFVWTAKQQRCFHSNISRRDGKRSLVGPFCSKSCCGKYGKTFQKNLAGMVEWQTHGA